MEIQSYNQICEKIRCYLHGEEHTDTHSVSLIDFYNISKAHGINIIVFQTIKDNILNKAENDLVRQWQTRNEIDLVQNLRQGASIIQVINILTSGGIDIIPLKGCILRDFYPDTIFRQMSDLDFLIRPEDAQKARYIMENNEYRNLWFGTAHDDGYQLDEFVKVELDRYLVEPVLEQFQFFENIWARAKQSSSNPHLYYLTPEDHYLYILTHFYSHCKQGGSGIRSLLDIYLYKKHYKNELDESYLVSCCKSLYLTNFRTCAELLSYKLFGCSEEVEQSIITIEQQFLKSYIQEMEEYIFNSGTYGTIKQNAQMQVAQNGKVNAILHRVFYPLSAMKYRYKVLDKWPVLLPLCWIHRAGKFVIRHRKRMISEFNAICSSEKAGIPFFMQP